jgi:peptide/nickel transport system substrate-binding protein
MSSSKGHVSRRDFLIRSSATAAAVSPLAAMLAACGSDSDRATSAGKPTNAVIDHLTWCSGEVLNNLDGRHLSAATIAATRLGLEGLLAYDGDGKLQPVLAESWSQPSPLKLVYKLRSGVTFWDGSPLTVEDVVYSMNTHRDPAFKSTQSVYYGSVKSVEATGPNEVTITLTKADALAQYVPAITGIVSKKFWEAHAKDIGTPGTLTMGTGPWKFTELVPEGHLELEANDAYWGGKPKIRRISLNVISSPSARLLAMRSGELDGTFDVPSTQSKPWENLDNASLTFAPELRVVFLAPNQTIKPWDDIHVRRALAHCVDKAGLLNAVFEGHGAEAATIVAADQWKVLLGDSEIEQLYAGFPEVAFDLDAARDELAQSSVPDGFSETLEYPSERPEIGQVAQSVAQNLGQIGVKLAVRAVPTAQWEGDLFSGKKGLQIAGFTPDLPDPANLPTALLASASGANLAKYADDSVDKLLTSQGAATDPAKRAEDLASALQKAAEALAYVPVVTTEFGMAIEDSYTYSGLGPWYMYENFATNVSAAA